MAKKKRYSSVSEMLRDAAPDESFRDEFKERVAQRQVLKHLLALRAARGLSQKDVADRLGCSQSRISKLENGIDADLKVGDLLRYAGVLGLRVGFTFAEREMTAVDQIKHHAFSIKRLMDRLAHLANVDEKVARAVADFFGEAFFNLVSMIQEAAGKLPMRPEDDAPYFQIAICEGEPPVAPVSDETSGTSEDDSLVAH